MLLLFHLKYLFLFENEVCLTRTGMKSKRPGLSDEKQVKERALRHPNELL